MMMMSFSARLLSRRTLAPARVAAFSSASRSVSYCSSSVLPSYPPRRSPVSRSKAVRACPCVKKSLLMNRLKLTTPHLHHHRHSSTASSSTNPTTSKDGYDEQIPHEHEGEYYSPYQPKRQWPPDMTKLSPKHQFRLERKYRRRAALKYARPKWTKLTKLAQWGAIGCEPNKPLF